MSAATLDSPRPTVGVAPAVLHASHVVDEPIELVPYHPSWPARFRVEAEVLRVALAPLAPRFEHIGSTAVPGLETKPIIDIMLGVRHPALVEEHARRLANFGYQLLPSAYDESGQRRFLVRTVRGMRTHHVHVVEFSGEHWHRLLLFRDLLRIDAALAADYVRLKRELCRQFARNRLPIRAARACSCSRSSAPAEAPVAAPEAKPVGELLTPQPRTLPRTARAAGSSAPCPSHCVAVRRRPTGV